MIRRRKIIETEGFKMQKKNKDNYPESISMEEYLIRRKKGREDALGKDNGMLPTGRQVLRIAGLYI
jgi:hypothetical protein